MSPLVCSGASRVCAFILLTFVLLKSVWVVVLTGFLCHHAFRQVPVAQWLACWTSNSKVVGSSPTRDAFLLFFQFIKHGIKVHFEVYDCPA